MSNIYCPLYRIVPDCIMGSSSIELFSYLTCNRHTVLSLLSDVIGRDGIYDKASVNSESCLPSRVASLPLISLIIVIWLAFVICTVTSSLLYISSRRLIIFSELLPIGRYDILSYVILPPNNTTDEELLFSCHANPPHTL